MVDLVQKLEELAVDASVSRGSLLFHSGTPASAAFVVRSGRVALVWAASEKVYPMCVRGAGSVLGLAAALNGEYSVTAKAVDDCEVGYVPAERVVALLQANAHLAFAAMRMTALESARMREIAAEPKSARRGAQKTGPLNLKRFL